MWGGLLRLITDHGLRRGLAGSRLWMIVAIVAVGARTWRQISRSEPEVLYRTRIHSGDILVFGAKEAE